MSRRVSEAGVPAPAVYDILEIEGRRGLLYERMTGPTMLNHVLSSPHQLLRCARSMARLQYDIHGFTTTMLPRQKEKLEHAIMDASGILPNKVDAILSVLDSMPEGESICHGDFHPDNVVITEKGCRALDWNGACVGHPLCDVARTSLMFQSPFDPLDLPAIRAFPARVARMLWNKVYIKEYCRLSNAKPGDIQKWQLPVAAARLREQIPGERDWLLGIIHEYLREYA